MLFPASEIDHAAAVQFVRRDLITNHFLCPRQRLANGLADALQDRLHFLGVRLDVIVYRFEVSFCHRTSSFPTEILTPHFSATRIVKPTVNPIGIQVWGSPTPSLINDN